MMGVPVKYNDDVEHRNTHPILLPKVETKRLTIPEKELLREITVLASTKKEEIPRGGKSNSISPRSGATVKRKSVLGVNKYRPGSGPKWKAGGSRYPNLHKSLLQEPSGMGKDRLRERITRPGN